MVFLTLHLPPKDDLELSSQPLVHCIDIMYDHEENIDFHTLGRHYKEACDKQDCSFCPPLWV